MAIVTRNQPQGLSRVNTTNPITAGLVSLTNFSSLGLDAVRVATQTPVGAPKLGATPQGVGPVLNGSNQSVRMGFNVSGPEGTVLLLVYFPVAMTGCAAAQNGASDGYIGFGWQNGGLFFGGTGIGTIGSFTGVRALSASWSATKVGAAFVDTVKKFNIASGTAPNGSGLSFPLIVGSCSYSGAPNGYSFNSQTPLMLAYWNRALSDAELASVGANPWQLFQAPQRPTLVAASAGPTNTAVNPSVGALALTGYAPAVAQSVNQALTPNAGTLSITGYAPSIAQPQAITPGVGSLTLTGYAPTIAQSSTIAINPGAGSLALLGYAPTVAQSANVAINPATGTMAFAGYAPTISQPQAVTAGAGALAITGYAPTVTQAITTNVVPGAGSLALTGYAPTIAQSANQQIAPQVGSVTFTGFAPNVAQSANQAVLPAVGSLTITGFAPSVVQQSASPSLVPGVGNLTIIGYAPEVVQSGGTDTHDGGAFVKSKKQRKLEEAARAAKWAAQQAEESELRAQLTGKQAKPAKVEKAPQEANQEAVAVLDDEDELIGHVIAHEQRLINAHFERMIAMISKFKVM